MGPVPFALSVSHFVDSVGSKAGFAAIIGLAMLALLYFAQARETATMRDRLDEADDHIDALTARLDQVSRAQTAAAQTGSIGTHPPAPVRPPVAARQPMGSAVAAVRQPANAVAAATAGAGPAVRSIPGAAPTPVRVAWAPAGVGAPPLASATKLVPTARAPIPVPVGASSPAPAGGEHTRGVAPPPATVAAGANGHAAGPPPPVPASAPAGAAAAAGSQGAPAAGAPAPPRVQIRPGGSGSGGGGAAASAGQRRPIPPSRPPAQRQSSLGTRLLPAVIGLAALVVIVVALIVITGGGSSPSKTASTGASTTATGASTRHHTAAPAFNPAQVTVAVLNGTAIYHLANDTDQILKGLGYQKGTIATAANQTHATTIIGYMPGKQADGLRVARALKLSSSAVAPADQDAQSVACQGSAAGSCNADVIVTVGQDLAGNASSTTTAG